MRTMLQPHAGIVTTSTSAILAHWKCDELSGNLIDSVGSYDLTASGSPSSAEGLFQTPGTPITVVADGLLGWYDAGDASSYPGSGSTWSDLSGNVRNIALSGSPAFTSDNGGGLVFTGTEYGETTLPNFNTLTGCTIMCIWKADTIAASFSGNPINYGDNLGLRQRYDGALDIYNRGGSFGAATITNHAASVETIYNFCATLSSTDLDLYENGVNTGAAHSGTPTFAGSTTVFRIGRFFHLGSFSEYFLGTVYVALVYSRALTPAEVAQNHNYYAARFGLSAV